MSPSSASPERVRAQATCREPGPWQASQPTAKSLHFVSKPPGRRVVALAHVRRVTVGAHVVPVLLPTRPVELVAGGELLVGVEIDPAPRVHVPRARVGLQASAGELEQVLLQRLEPEAVLHPEVGDRAVGPRCVDEVAAVARGELRLREVSEHPVRVGELDRARVLRAAPGRGRGGVALGAGFAADELGGRRRSRRSGRGRRRFRLAAERERQHRRDQRGRPIRTHRSARARSSDRIAAPSSTGSWQAGHRLVSSAAGVEVVGQIRATARSMTSRSISRARSSSPGAHVDGPLGLSVARCSSTGLTRNVDALVLERHRERLHPVELRAAEQLRAARPCAFRHRSSSGPPHAGLEQAAPGHVVHLEPDPVAVLEQHRVVAGRQAAPLPAGARSCAPRSTRKA